MSGRGEDVLFAVGGTTLRGTLYRHKVSTTRPLIIMGNGLGGVCDVALTPYAEAFQAAGWPVMTFDYRHFGHSDGQPRQLFSIARQLADWRAAIRLAATLPGVAGSRPILWGTSFGGSHVLTLAAEGWPLTAAIAQCPNADFLKTVLETPPSRLMRLIGAGLRDAVSRAFGGAPHLVPLVGPPDGAALMVTEDALEGYPRLAAGSATWRNEVTPGFLLTLGLYRPGRQAGRIAVPLLVQICGRDGIAAPDPARKAATLTPKGVIQVLDCDHFEIYADPYRKDALAGQFVFLNGLQ